MVKLMIRKGVIRADACAYINYMIRPASWINIRRSEWGLKGLKKLVNTGIFECRAKMGRAKESSKKSKKISKKVLRFFEF